jgi:hypothetical protein
VRAAPAKPLHIPKIAVRAQRLLCVIRLPCHEFRARLGSEN